MQPWKTLSKKLLLSLGKWLSVEEHAVELPDGRVIPDWAWVITPDYVNVVVVDTAGRFLLFRQQKYGLDGESLAPVGGYIEPGEAPLLAAQRETMEEMGCAAEEWVDLGRFRVDPNRGICMGTLYLALGARKVAERNADDLEEQQLIALSAPEVRRALREGQFKTLAWAANVAFALLYLEDHQQGRS